MSRFPRLTLIAGAATLCVGLLATAPAMASRGPELSRAARHVYVACALVCHQRPERSFNLHGTKLPVCARCLGLYVSGWVGVLGWLAMSGVRRAPRARVTHLDAATWRRWLIVSGLPTIGSVATAAIGWWDPPNLVRAMLAVPLGLVVGMMVTAVAAGDLR